jgi:hypothetical protein
MGIGARWSKEWQSARFRVAMIQFRGNFFATTTSYR